MTVKTLIQKPKPNLLRQFANFTRTTAGLEKTCRLIQSLAQLAIELDITPGSTTTAQWQTARSQIALSKSHKPLRKNKSSNTLLIHDGIIEQRDGFSVSSRSSIALVRFMDCLAGRRVRGCL